MCTPIHGTLSPPHCTAVSLRLGSLCSLQEAPFSPNWFRHLPWALKALTLLWLLVYLSPPLGRMPHTGRYLVPS